LTGKILRLYPPPAREISASAIYEDLELPPPVHSETSRPYVIMNMVSSVDGRIAVDGKSSSIGSETDRQTMRTLRSKADAVMVGAGTLRAEKLTLGLDDPGGPQPLAVIATSSGDIPLEANLITAEGQEVLVITREDITLHSGEHRVLRLSAEGSGDLDLGEALEVLKAEHAVDLLLVEGGPRLNYSLISEDLADELFLTLAPTLLGGTPDQSLTILNGPVLVTREMKLLSAHLAGDELYLRYGLRQRS
jgi:2,5-diamino-6-(ribosylamino)-4(3H)-pyrimidinone 5'-phosphate reductase